MSNEMKNKKRPVVFMTGAGGGMGSESFKQMLPDIGKKYDLIVFDRDTEKNHDFFDPYKGTKGHRQNPDKGRQGETMASFVGAIDTDKRSTAMHSSKQ